MEERSLADWDDGSRRFNANYFVDRGEYNYKLDYPLEQDYIRTLIPTNLYLDGEWKQLHTSKAEDMLYICKINRKSDDKYKDEVSDDR